MNKNLEALKKLESDESKTVKLKTEGKELEFEIKRVNVGLIERYNDAINPIKTDVSLKRFNAHKRQIEKLRESDDESKLEEFMIDNDIISQKQIDNIDDLVDIRKSLIAESCGIPIEQIDAWFRADLLRDLSQAIYEFSK